MTVFFRRLCGARLNDAASLYLHARPCVVLHIRAAMTARARESAIYTAREFAARATPSTLWNDDDVIASIDGASRLVASLIRDLFGFIENADFTEQERLTLLYDDSPQAFSMRNGALRTLQWIQDRINASAPDLAGIVFRWVGYVAGVLAQHEQTLAGRARAADLAFDLLLRSLPPADGALGAFALKYSDLAMRIDDAFGAGTSANGGRSRTEVLRLLQAYYARRGLRPAAFEAQRDMRGMIDAYWREADVVRGAREVSMGRQLRNLRDWWRETAMPSAHEFIQAGADPAAILLPSGAYDAKRQTFGDVWVQSLEREILEIARCDDYDLHVALLGVAGTLMRVNLDLAESAGRYAYWIGLRMQQKIMRASTVILRAGSPKIQVSRFKEVLNRVLARYITGQTYVEVRALLGADEDALLRAFTAALDYTYGNPRQAWRAVLLPSEAQVQWTSDDRAWVLEHASV